MNVPPNKKAHLVLIGQDPVKLAFLRLQEKYLLTLGKLESIDGGKDLKKPPRSASAVVQGVELFVPLADLIDLDLEKNRLTKEITRLEGLISGLNSKLANESFVSRAPRDVIDKERQKLHDYSDAVKKLKLSLESLG
jgi:valyl-tRNA synthetase